MLSSLMVQWFILASVSLTAAAGPAEPKRIVVITRMEAPFQEPLKQFAAAHPNAKVEFRLLPETLDCGQLQSAALVFVNGRVWSPEMRACQPVVQRLAARGTLFGALTGEILRANWRVAPSPALEKTELYLRYGGDENLLHFLLALASTVDPEGSYAAAPPKPSRQEGIYHPAARELFPDLGSYLAWYESARRVPAGAPRVAVTFFASSLANRDMAVVDALVEALEARGIGVIPVFGWPFPKLEPFLFLDGQPQVKLILSTNLPMMAVENVQWLSGTGLRIINLITTSEPYEAWVDSLQGLPPNRANIQIGTPERTGATEPMLVATTERTPQGNKTVVIPERIADAAERAANWIRLVTKPNREKRLALIYFNNPPGKGTLGASYLNLMPSLRNVIVRLHQEGYSTGQFVPSADDLKRLMMLGGRNAGEYAEGEMASLAREGHARLMPVRRYRELFHRLDKRFQEAVLERWGPPEKTRQMVFWRGDDPYFIIPGFQLGNLFLGPQPLRASWEAAGATAHDRNTPPPHHYIAAYLWYKHEFGADALIHFGRHGTLEWLPGKDMAQARWDAGEALTGNLPHAYFYVVDGGGEFLQVKRRSGGVIISHLTPMLAGAGLPPEQQKLRGLVENFRQTETSPALARRYADEMRQLLAESGLARLWGVEPLPSDDSALVHEIDQRLGELEDQAIPLGLHTIGEPLKGSDVVEALAQFLRNSVRKEEAGEMAALAPSWAKALVENREPEPRHPQLARVLPEARTWLGMLRESSSQELLSLVRFLEGRYLPSGVSGDPLRTPDALPTGRNMHDTDPRTFPTPAAWQVGRQMAEALIEQQRQKLGRYPEKISFVLWYGETTRHQGIAEAQALALLGVEPIWNARGHVDDVRLIPAERLKRPRIDVLLTMSGLYRDNMPEKVALLDKAVRLAAEAPEDNVVRRNTDRAARQLESQGMKPEEARQLAQARLYGPPPGVFGAGLAGMVESSRDEGDQKRVGELYLRNMGFAYSAAFQGRPASGALRAQLANNDVVIHSRSTNLYGVLDNDDTFQFAGGLNAATAVASGKAPEFLVSNVRRPGEERFEAMSHFLARELQSRAWNPKWIEGMKSSGYAGARQMAREIEHLYGMRATAPEQVAPEVWQKTFDVLVADRQNLGLQEFFARENPHAQQMIAARLLEVERQGAYRFSEADRRLLMQAYLDSVRRFGAACTANVCNNAKLKRHFEQLVSADPLLSRQQWQEFQQRMASSLQAPPAIRPARRSSSPLAAVAARKPERAGLAALFDSIREVSMREFERRRQKPVSTGEAVFLLLSLSGGWLYAAYRRRVPFAPLTVLDFQLRRGNTASGD